MHELSNEEHFAGISKTSAFLLLPKSAHFYFVHSFVLL